VYSYQDITVSNVEDDSIGKASVNFKVKKSFIEENDGSVGDVRLSRFKDGGWQAFEAESTGETDTYHRMESQVPGFSTFAVTLVDEDCH
jgi:PGF-pre-PGF domain-containing protein